jgi:hypothetical protein
MADQIISGLTKEESKIARNIQHKNPANAWEFNKYVNDRRREKGLPAILPE